MVGYDAGVVGCYGEERLSLTRRVDDVDDVDDVVNQSHYTK